MLNELAATPGPATHLTGRLGALMTAAVNELDPAELVDPYARFLSWVRAARQARAAPSCRRTWPASDAAAL